ncbi:hypothetical protein CSOJ01_05920 [Colletotrichum sojae]|uniref:Uncharacterized protein n=1 Tax=Colletotrichum sojae TaxID=2175907 RepID=A0A8H6MWS1_9PEZI|nr:hypothetical protein CSOJ01_05920 [Colletotrichum sojae]
MEPRGGRGGVERGEDTDGLRQVALAEKELRSFGRWRQPGLRRSRDIIQHRVSPEPAGRSARVKPALEPSNRWRSLPLCPTSAERNWRRLSNP